MPAGTTFKDVFDKRSQADLSLGNEINKALKQIEDRNRDRGLEGIFTSVDFNSPRNLGEDTERNSRLRRLLEVFNQRVLDMHPDHVQGDVIGNTYMFLVERFASEADKKAGEFYTPHKVSELVAQIGKSC